MTYYNKGSRTRSCTRLLLLLVLLLSARDAEAQINIKGNVFGGARQADVGGSTNVSIGTDHLDVVIDAVYGGNDISGSVGTAAVTPFVPVVNTDEKTYVDNSFNAFIHTHPSPKTLKDGKTVDAHSLFIGRLFGGGNGDYTYTANSTGQLVVTEVGSTEPIATVLNRPLLTKAYLELQGGTIVHAYGGGNNATVTENTTICVDNESDVVTTIKDEDGNEMLDNNRIAEMKVNTVQTYVNSDEFQFARVFGGNNKADMSIPPTWFLKKGKIRDLYSGGNEGRMTSETGLLLEIDPDPAPAVFKVDNVYGGCRRSDVCPEDRNGNKVIVKNLDGYHFPEKLSARVLVRGGDINNVYGGNDISGRVYGGNAVGIYSDIRGNVYGGGNGSYPYTDNESLKDTEMYRDYYYAPGSNTVDALNAFRPNAEAVSLRVKGSKDATTGDITYTKIGGAIYVGGNSATLKSDQTNPLVELKIGSYVIADKVYLGNNGEGMVTTADENDVLRMMNSTSIASNGTKFNSMNLLNETTFAKYMQGAAMTLHPRVVFDAESTEGEDYVEHSTYFGSFYCGCNRGSMMTKEKTTINFNHKVIIYNKLVGGCNDAYIPATAYNAACNGGLIGSLAEQANYGTDGLFVDANNQIQDRLELNLSGLKIQPKRLTEDGTLIWNTVDLDGNPIVPAGLTTGTRSGDDLNIRLTGGNIYGGCYNSGHVNGNVIINLNEAIFDRKGEFAVFDIVEENEGEARLYGNNSFNVTKVNSGVILDRQGMDVLGTALNVFGGGYGENSEVWGSTTINLNKGYTFQIFGGGEKGAIGKGERNATTKELEYDDVAYDERFSCHVNLKGTIPGNYRGATNNDDDMAEAEFIYGGGFLAPVIGNTYLNLGNGRIFNSFAGSCNADIKGHTETYVGRNTDSDTDRGFPWVRDHIYGGNDLGGRILGQKNYLNRVSSNIRSKVYNPLSKSVPDVVQASAYIEYVQGRVDYIYGGCYGDYDYKNSHYRKYTNDDGSSKPGFVKPRMVNAFINFKPNTSSNNTVNRIYGAGQGHSGELDRDVMQDRSYVLIDIQQTDRFKGMQVFGAGENSGVGMRIGDELGTANTLSTAITAANADGVTAAAVIDLMRGQITAAYGGSNQEGITRRTIVNVPSGSTIQLNRIFGGAYGLRNDLPCDVYESHVNYSSGDAIVGAYRDGIFGGNNNARRTLYSFVNINSPVWYNKDDGYLATVFGGGYGENTWTEYTQVNLNNHAQLYEVYGGGYGGMVLNKESVNALNVPLSLGSYYSDDGLNNALVTANGLGKNCNTNVNINQGAYVSGYLYNGSVSGGYAYGGGYGSTSTVSGTTYIGLHGGKTFKDIYAGGTLGGVFDKYKLKSFTAATNAYIEGGTCRNVYGGGWEGSVGYHKGAITENDSNDPDIPGETHVVIGKRDGTSFLNGIPAVERNGYAGGEGGPVFGTASITLYKGYIGYRYHDDWTDDTSTPNIDERYEEKIEDETNPNGREKALYDSGCLFGGGYVDNSSVDISQVTMYGGHVRNALFGGGEIAAIGRGTIQASGENNSVRVLQGIYKAGKTNVELYDGYVHRNVFGGGRGYNNLGEGGTLYSDGYVFGQTKVFVYGGEIGTDDGLALGYGNVFGGGDIGYVYSAYEKSDGTLCFGNKIGERYEDEEHEGYYYEYEGGAYVKNSDGKYVLAGGEFVTDTQTGENILTEDCKVLVEPHCLVESASAVTIGGKTYQPGDYVDTYALNTLGNKTDAAWASLDDDGIIIHNAVFAGGNTSSGNADVYANATTVFGNATASVHDVYARDLITLGTGHTGGLYGDGNLTFVDGYRGLNITNYGTDYYNIEKEISLETYKALPEREAAYYELRYRCLVECTDTEGKTYSKNSTITQDELITLFDGIMVDELDDDGNVVLEEDGVTPKKVSMVNANGTPNDKYWEENGVCSRYAGRPMNTIQRADFCGVWGSRMVMQGARDRVPDVADYTNYTINRVREVSLNKKQDHGNYFGIYNIVNYLGALTSDFDFGHGDANDSAQGDVGNGTERTSDNTDTETYRPQYTGQTFYGWKKNHINDRTRNNGNSHNQVALASGVYLELTTEESTGTDLWEKDWGYITGVIELDLINVQPGVGGGFVYAKNVHGKRKRTGKTHTTITDLNQGAVSLRMFEYATDDANKMEWQTSGNFVHSTQTIIDDCYNISGKYKGSVETKEAMPAHYWYIKGQVYVYPQLISAFTGSPNAYSEKVEIPLTITAASHGTMKLLNVMPNRYAYYTVNNTINGVTNQTKLEGDRQIVINDVSYGLNDPISYWDWYLLPASERALFVEDTYVVREECWIGNEKYPEGKVLLNSEYKTLKNSNPKVYQKVEDGTQDVDFDDMFRSSNNLSHDTGYILTYQVNNPSSWNTWYTAGIGNWNEKKPNETDGYEDGPTYHLTSTGTGGLLGQESYNVGNVISEKVYNTYQSVKNDHPTVIPTNDPTAEGYNEEKVQAEFEEAYIVTELATIGTDHYYPGATVSKTFAGEHAELKAEQAYICTSTIKLTNTEYIYLKSKMTLAELNRYKETYPALASDIEKNVVKAYYCTSPGLYGGDFYETGRNYRGLEVWSSMSESDRNSFEFNYDALDLLIDPLYSRNELGAVAHPDGMKYQYDSKNATLVDAEANPAGYSLEQPIDYTASYNGDSNLPLSESVAVKRNGTDTSTNQIEKDDELTRTVYESLPNEQRHYTAIEVKSDLTYYVVNTTFQVGNTPYAAGTTVTSDTYNGMSLSEKSNITTLTFVEADKGKKFYFCRESYTVRNDEDGVEVTPAANVKATDANGNVITVTGTYGTTEDVPVGLVIDASNYDELVEHNKQKNFIIHGISPTATSTLYVSRNSDIFDLSKNKIITVVYQYDYEESDASGNITPVSERHVVNITIEFKSGKPTIEDISKPQIVMPGSKLGLREPFVTPGAYQVTGGGWSLFPTKRDAESQDENKAIEYVPNSHPLYWYQDGYYIAYYAMSYLGKTYSNHQPVSVANYHDLDAVMADTEHHMYVDNPEVKRNSKIYLDNRACKSDPTKSELDLLKDLYDLSLGTTLDSHVKGCADLEFFLNGNVSPKKYQDWTPIGDATQCFEGTLHGDGYTVSGLNHSLFGNLCGSVYNLGVTGSFTGAGVAETGIGYVENCWVSTSSTAAKTSKPVFNSPTIEANTTRPYRIVNCYYEEDDDVSAGSKYTNHTGSYGTPTRMGHREFHNGTVAYDLNGFYLNKRYHREKQTASDNEHWYLEAAADGSLTLPDDPVKGYYPASPDYQYGNIGYVESRYEDGDFRYASGTLPESDEQRQRTVKETVNGKLTDKEIFAPIWPDDYLFFGQTLTYGYDNKRPHDEHPSHLMKNSSRLPQNNQNNRVYRAPAYFRNKTMDVVHFNPAANLAATDKPESVTDNTMHPAYPGMTAVDFKGHGDTAWGLGLTAVPTGADIKAEAFFYPPLLDDAGLLSVENNGETPNLLVYAPSETQNQKTFDRLTEYFTEEPFDTYYDSNYAYKCIGIVDASSIHGHLVQSDLQTTIDHLLVDKNDFNCPISYNMGTGKRMWYQRLPENYVTIEWNGQTRSTKGWEGISIPFSAELVTTQDKGELTHFYEGSTKGHEYWLREFNGIAGTTDNVVTAQFERPAKGGNTKEYTNTYLWDTYYSKDNYLDYNEDEYKKTYYEDGYTVTDYPYLGGAKPYIIGFPGNRFYEFDLQGEEGAWVPEHRYENGTIAHPGRQTITFASPDTGIEIGVSDEEKAGVTAGGYTFRPSYLNDDAVLATGQHAFLLSTAADSYDETTPVATGSIVAFRPYFVGQASQARTRSIVFTDDQSQLGGDDDPNLRDGSTGSLSVFAKRKKIVVESALSEAADVRIVNTAGITVSIFAIEPGETVETRINNSGVYIVRTEDGQYLKKIAVK